MKKKYRVEKDTKLNITPEAAILMIVLTHSVGQVAKEFEISKSAVTKTALKEARRLLALNKPRARSFPKTLAELRKKDLSFVNLAIGDMFSNVLKDADVPKAGAMFVEGVAKGMLEKLKELAVGEKKD